MHMVLTYIMRVVIWGSWRAVIKVARVQAEVVSGFFAVASDVPLRTEGSTKVAVDDGRVVVMQRSLRTIWPKHPLTRPQPA